MSIRVAVTGATGRLGTLVCAEIAELDGFELVAALNSSSPDRDTYDADVLVDVSHPDVSESIVTAALRRGMKVLVGTSGWSAERIARLQPLIAADTGVIIVPNFSLGSVLATAAAAAIAPYFDAVEIVEAHHAAKVDSPSGTAVRTAERIAESREGKPALTAPYSDQPARGELIAGVPVHSLRLPGVVAKQDVIFAGAGETLTITHDTSSPESYRAGIRAALRALPDATGLTVGLDRVLGISLGGH